MTDTTLDIPKILADHTKWLHDEPGGARANLDGASLAGASLAGATLARASLAGAHLAGANLAGANLARASLARASLAGANLDGASLARASLARASLAGAVHAWAQVAFSGHGERGRMLTAIRHKEGDAPVLFCGCFNGNQTELRKYIADHDEKYRATRTAALDAVLMLLDMRNPE